MNPLASIGREAKALWSEGRGPSLGAIAGTWGLLLGTRMIYPVLLPALRDDFGLSLSVAGLLVTILWLGSALGQLPSGILADRFSERSVMATGTLVAALGVTLVVAAPTAAVLFAATALVGVGQSLYPIARITILTDMYPDRIGSALGVTMATGDLGQTIVPPIAGTLAAAIAWQAGFGMMVPGLLVGSLALMLVLPSQTGSTDTGGTSDDNRLGELISDLREGDVLFLAFILFLYVLVWQSFTGFYPTYLTEEKPVSKPTASLLFSLFFAFGVVIKPAAGAAYDRIGPRRSLVAVLSGPVVGLGLLPFVDSLPALVVITALVSTMLGSGAITQSFLSEAFSDEARGTGLGIVRTSAATLGAAGPVLFGVIAERGYFDEGYFLLAGLMAVIVVLTLVFFEE
ncbi:major facilitator superfamily MFS_1 [Halorhabdus utahensis DSM 12940]|uniref:Major facilitator superfamily MFS_1 n=1 Tax=Halorhabdus utahensis (strain DSM 12940 / JCM 11049 / AX-2) TaxID=519442 RepID=C7NMQ2_HALUD|nr:MFS transporter [Halorhabdus utahensis]ACV11365.1 major facilitator superfamily MFS_1 [Halorhabdus utahensis DSM 12940]